jgi:plastocyanin
MGRSGTMLCTGIAAVLALAASGCGSDPQTEPTGQLAIAKAPSKSGDDQTKAAGQLLDSPLRVLVTRDQVPAAGATVRWTTPDGGSFGDATSVADDNGIASTDWTLGEDIGNQTAQAAIEGADGSPITFTAHASFDGGGGGEGEAAIVLVTGPPKNAFNPATITIKVGETVTWRWGPSAVGHNVTPDTGVIPAGEESLFSAPHEYSYTFNQAGTYTYHCAAHGAAMSGTVVVEPAS